MPIPGAVLAAGLGAATTGGLNLFGSGQASKRAIKFWHMQNKYNHPSAQMARLREAGLNPNLIYGGSTGQAAGLADQPDAPPPVTFDNPIRELTKFQEVKRVQAQTNNLEAQNTVLSQDAALKGVQASNIAVKTAKDSFDLELAQELRDTSLEAAKMALRHKEQLTIGAQLDNDFKDATIKDRIKDVFYRAQMANSALKGQDLLNALRQLEVDLKRIGIERNDPWYFRIFGRNMDLLNKQLNFK